MRSITRTGISVATAVAIAAGLLYGSAGGASKTETSDAPDLVASRGPDAQHGSSPVLTDRGAAGGAVPEGWEPYVDYDPGCGFYVPTEKHYLPPPIRWESCATMDKGHGLPGPDGMACRRMLLDWESGSTQHTTAVVPMYVHNGTVTMFLRRIVGNVIYDLIADADGPVHQALLQTGRCRIWGAHTNDGKAIYRVRDNKSGKVDPGGGAIGGDVDSLRPRVYLPRGHKPSEQFSQEYAVGPRLFVESSGALDRIYSFSTGAVVDTVTYAPEDSGMLYARYSFHGDDLFWSADSSERTAVKVWTRDTGTRTLVGWPGDSSRGADGFATDGVDMVWMEASGRTSPSASHAKYETWTAKYSTDPAAIAATKRRVRSESPNSYSERYTVGCGYAAVATHPDLAWGQSAGFRLIRLSDGFSWDIHAESMEQMHDALLGRPLAVTCDEVFVTGSTLSHYEIARIRIDSLGPGTSPE